MRVFRHAAPSPFLVRHAGIWAELIERYEPGDAPTFVQLERLGTFRVLMGGKPPYAFVLVNPQICDVRIWNPARWNSRAAAQTGQLYVSFRSVFLQEHGLEGARLVLRALTALFCLPLPGFVHVDAGPEFDRIARVDLAVDTIEPHDMQWADLDRYVCRARKLDTWAHLTPDNVEQLLKIDLSAGSFLPMEHPQRDDALPQLARSASRVLHAYVKTVVQDLETHGEAALSRVVSHNRKPQTIYFGRFGSQLYARRYNKLGSLVVQNKLWMLDVWRRNGWDGETRVHRTEFSISGDFLKSYSITRDGSTLTDCRDLDDLEHVAPVLWDYLVTDWLSMRDPQAGDSNYRRWPVSASWAVLAGAFGIPDQLGQRDHRRTLPREDTHLVLQSRGCSVSTVALRAHAHGSYDSALQSIYDDLTQRLGQDDFKDDVIHRMLEFGLDDYTDTQLSALFRKERLLEKTGS